MNPEFPFRVVLVVRVSRELFCLFFDISALFLEVTTGSTCLFCEIFECDLSLFCFLSWLKISFDFNFSIV
jgi:hypothetical protein